MNPPTPTTSALAQVEARLLAAAAERAVAAGQDTPDEGRPVR